MGRRETVLALLVALFGGGISALLAVTALPPHSPYYGILIVCGVAAMCVGSIGLLLMLLFPPRAPIPHALLESQLAELREIEDFVARKSEGDLRETFDFPALVDFNTKMVRQSLTGQPEEGVVEFSAGGQSRIDLSRTNFKIGKPGEGHQGSFIPGRVGFINTSRKYAESRATVARMAASPRLPTEIMNGLRRLDATVERNSCTLTAVLDEALQSDDNRILNFGKGGEPQYAWVNNTYWHRFEHLRPVADEIGAAIRKYLKVT
jgi:hypothetical protein